LNPLLTNISVIPNGVDYEYFAPQKRLKVQGSGHKEIPRKTMRLRPNAKSEIRNPKSELSPMPHVYPVKFLPRGMPQPILLGASGDHFTGAPCLPREMGDQFHCGPMLLFTGALDYHANVDGLTWFCEEILPGIKTNIPEVQFYIVGSNPCQKVRNLANGNGVNVTGFVEDIRPFYQLADLCVIPLRLARGIQNKVLEAMSMEKSVVTTNTAIQGISALNGEHLIVANTPEDFSKAILTLLNDEDRRRKLGIKAREFVKANYNWQRNITKLEELILGGVSSQGSES
jgi:glycosyltransferase involved in cell wall biosynthesis